MNKNLYWATYCNLEKEMLSITNQINFNDDHLIVYSEKFIELLLRTSIEIEAISKDLYLQNGGDSSLPDNEMYFDTVCIGFLDDKWSICKKKIQIVNINMSFSNSLLCPLHKANKRGTSGSKWKQAYQAVKHNRSANFKKANLDNCINALGALFILNLYYRNEEPYFNDYSDVNKFDSSCGSQIFTVSYTKINESELATKGKEYSDVYSEDSIYCISFSKEYAKESSDLFRKMELAVSFKSFVEEENNKKEILRMMNNRKYTAFLNKLRPDTTT